MVGAGHHDFVASVSTLPPCVGVGLLLAEKLLSLAIPDRQHEAVSARGNDLDRGDGSDIGERDSQPFVHRKKADRCQVVHTAYRERTANGRRVRRLSGRRAFGRQQHGSNVGASRVSGNMDAVRVSAKSAGIPVNMGNAPAAGVDQFRDADFRV